MELEITIFIDRQLDLKITKLVHLGQTVGELRALLAADDPTGQATVDSFGLAHARPEGDDDAPLVALHDDEEITDELSVVEIFNPEEVISSQHAVPPVTTRSATAPDPPSVSEATARSASNPPPPDAAAAATAAAKAQVAKPSSPEVEALLKRSHAALAVGADFDAANDALGALGKAIRTDSISRPRLLLARGLLWWRWSKFDRALSDLQHAKRMGVGGADYGLLALNMCLRRWPEASSLAQKRSQEALDFIDRVSVSSRALDGVWSPSPAEYEPRTVEVMPGIRQMDVRFAVDDKVELGARFFIQVRSGTPILNKPMLVYFHGNAENVDTYKDAESFRPIKESGASALVVDFRGYGFSAGGDGPSFVHVCVDAERVCDALPAVFAEKGLPWPWPAQLFVLGRSIGSLIACHLAATKPDLFGGGIVLESAFCGSHAPGAEPPPEPPSDGNPLGQSGKKFVRDEEEINGFGRVCQDLVLKALPPGSYRAEDLAHFVYLLGNEDLIRGYDGRLLILHGGIDTIIPKGHAQRLCDAAQASMRKLVVISSSGHNDLSFTEKYIQALKTFLAGK